MFKLRKYIIFIKHNFTQKMGDLNKHKKKPEWLDIHINIIFNII
jgi:hypothetical protein